MRALPARVGDALVSGRRLGRTRRCEAAMWPRQFRAALSHHLGHRRRHRRALSSDVRLEAIDIGLLRLGLPPRRSPRLRYSRRPRHRHFRSYPGRRFRTRAAPPPIASRVSRISPITAESVLITSGGIGGDHRQSPRSLAGGPSGHNRPGNHGRRRAGLRRRPDAGRRRQVPLAPMPSTRIACGTIARVYGTGIPIWPNHGIRILPGPSAIWLDANGRQDAPPLFARL